MLVSSPSGSFGYKQKTTLTVAVSDLICHTHVETAVVFFQNTWDKIENVFLMHQKRFLFLGTCKSHFTLYVP